MVNALKVSKQTYFNKLLIMRWKRKTATGSVLHLAHIYHLFILLSPWSEPQIISQDQETDE